jgi:chromatin remodeling complex protein RSC6
MAKSTKATKKAVPKKTATKKAVPKKTATKKTKTATKKVAPKKAVAKKVASKKVDEVCEVSVVEETKTKKRRKVSRETVLEYFDEVIAKNEAEIALLRSSEKKAVGIKYLKSVSKDLKKLRTHAAKLIKKPRAKNPDTKSGFLKPVPVSGELCKFTGWDPEEMRSRVDVTKFICSYIKDNDLQNPEDKRQILADKKLCALLNYDSKKDGPLTYYMIQSYIKPHFIKSA